MVRENMTAKKTRYICVKVNGLEVYTEEISSKGRMRDHLPAVKIRLREIKRLFPMGRWSMKIEQQWPEKVATHYQSINVLDGKMEDEVYCSRSSVPV